MSLRSAFSLLLLIGLSACESNTVTSTDPLPTGIMVGHVSLYNAGFPQRDTSGVRVTLDGTGRSTFTDESGEFRFDGLPTRTYSISYELEGYGLMKQPMVSFIGGSVVRIPTTYMMAIPKCGSIFDDIRQIDTSYIEAYAHAVCSDHDSMIGFVNDQVLFVFSNSRDVSAETGKYKFAALGQSGQPRGTAAVFLAKEQLQAVLNIDDSIYVAAYNTSGASWTDPLTERLIYTGHNPVRDRTLSFKWNKKQ